MFVGCLLDVRQTVRDCGDLLLFQNKGESSSSGDVYSDTSKLIGKISIYDVKDINDTVFSTDTAEHVSPEKSLVNSKKIKIVVVVLRLGERL
jgi:hypothetical protein